jgi:hypothetical protein
MKQLLLILFVQFFSLAGFAQGLTMDKVPSATAAAFKAKFPNGSQPGWGKAGADVFEVQFFNGKKRQSALFNATGKWIRTDSEINYGAVPMKVQNAFAREFEGYQIQEVYEVESSESGTTYEITAFKGARNFLAVFSAKGELLKKEEGE